jgi:hypothetical protein
MAKIYKAPEGYDPPEIDWKNLNIEAHNKREQEYIERLREWCKKRATGHKDDDLLGVILSFGVADGAAQYMVCGVHKRYLEVIHLELGDAWRAHRLIEQGMDKHEARLQMKRRGLFGNSREKV